MLNFYQDQIESDSTIQNTLQQAFFNISSEKFNINLSAFSRYCPSILKQLANYEIVKYKLFCNKLSQANILDITNGCTLYSIDPLSEITQEVDLFIQSAVVVQLADRVRLDSNINWPTEKLSRSSTVIMFGLGLGLQVELLLEKTPPKILVIYEPDCDFFYSSMKVINWLNIFEIAERNGTLISIQLANAGSNIAAVLSDLIQYQPELKKIYIYRHIANPVMDEVINYMIKHSGDIASLCLNDEHFLGFNNPIDYVVPRAEGILGNSNISIQHDNESIARFKLNLVAFKNTYPDVANLIENYQPKSWFYIRKQQKNNIWHNKRNLLMYEDSEVESEKTVNDFLQKTHVDTLFLLNKGSYKFRNYIHYKHLAKLQNIFENLKSTKQHKNNYFESLIIFGIGNGCYIKKIIQQSDINKLYLFEPNVDLFYASLFSFDWQELFNKMTKNNQKIYLNIGGSDSDYFDDVMQQFYRNGAFSIASTYVFQTYNNPALAKSVNLLKKQLKVILAIGDYYDSARFSISHTFANFKASYNWLKADRTLYSGHSATEIPVFIVGNGPSLDASIEYLKLHQHNAIVISCGTALKALYELGIQPDFHAEVEQNRSTYRWINQVNDEAYLKAINIISVNGLHPDTADLFADVFLAFKEGEAATYVFKQLLTGIADIAGLPYAYPTVSNLAVNFALHAGFKQLYLFGVDLGYVDPKNHHSQFSAYYNKEGKSIYDYQKVHGVGIVVPGNFRPTVQTKIEFDVSRQMMEKTIAAYGPQIEVYNCSDGAKIKGAVTLQPANILITECNGHVQENLQHFLTTAFYQESFFPQTGQLLTVFNIDQVRTSIEQWCDLISTEITDSTAAKQQVEQQWQLFKQLSAEQGSLLFPLLHGSTTYILGLLTKLISFMTDKENLLEALKQYNYVVSVWHDYLQAVVDDFCNEPLKLDETK